MTKEELIKAIRHRLEQCPTLNYIFLPKDWIEELLLLVDKKESKLYKTDAEGNQLKLVQDSGNR